MLISLPMTVRVSRKKNFSLNLNQYRNVHFLTLNRAKIVFKEMVKSTVTKLPLYNRIRLTYIAYPKTKRLFDAANVCSVVDKFFSDALVEFGKLPDDNYLHLPEIIYKFGNVDKQNPRVEVLIEDLTTQPQTSEPKQMKILLDSNDITSAIETYIRQNCSFSMMANMSVDMSYSKGSCSCIVTTNTDEPVDTTSPDPVVKRQAETPAPVSNISTGEERKDPAQETPKKAAVTSIFGEKPLPPVKTEAPKPVASTANPFAGSQETEEEEQDEDDDEILETLIDEYQDTEEEEAEEQPTPPVAQKPKSIFNFKK